MPRFMPYNSSPRGEALGRRAASSLEPAPHDRGISDDGEDEQIHTHGADDCHPREDWLRNVSAKITTRLGRRNSPRLNRAST